MKFDITKRVELSYLGDEWKECYLEFIMPSYHDIKEFAEKGKDNTETVEKGLEKLTGLFKSGYAVSDGKKVEVKKEDIKDLPMEVVTKSLETISGQVDPKESGNSTSA